tara:strand:+ start:260 stop:1561 length:1302 start_codon:yes stop_codon:yes gene_type:complete
MSEKEFIITLTKKVSDLKNLLLNSKTHFKIINIKYMKKKSLQSLFLTGALGMMAFGVSAQQGLVDKTLHTTNVLVEDFTGATCGYCPDATTRIEKLMDDNGRDKVYAMAIHSGSFTGGDKFLNQFADALLSHAGTPGSKPIGRVNRRLDGTAKTYSRGKWTNPHASAVLASGDSPVNLGVKAVMTGDDIKIDVEVYFPASVGTNMRIATAVVQTGYMSDQSDYGSHGKWTGDYKNIDALRWMSTTDALGENLSTTNKGDFSAYNYTCTIEPDWKKASDDITYTVIVYATDGDNGEVLQVVGVPLVAGGVNDGGVAKMGGTTYDRYFPGGNGDHNDTWGGIKTGVETLAESIEISIYPNPITSNTKVIMTLPTTASVSYEVINVLGVVVDSKNLGELNGLNEIDFDSDFTSVQGTYILRLMLDSEIVTRRLTVM